VLTRPLDWRIDGRDWPHREASRFVTAAGLRWHVQEMGSGPVALLVHGTAASTHSWSGLAPRLAECLRVVAMDLPGHGFTASPAPHRFRPVGMARALDGLLGVLGVRPSLVIGHSAGAAILARMCLDGRVAPRVLVSLNGAFLPFRGIASPVFSPLAKLLARGELVATLIARQAARPGAVERLIRGTGSRLDAPGIERYRRLVCTPRHVAGTLRMAANWDLAWLRRELPQLPTELVLVVGRNDRSVVPAEAYRVRRELVPEARLIELPGVGHLAHEECPEVTAGLILGIARGAGVLVP